MTAQARYFGFVPWGQLVNQAQQKHHVTFDIEVKVFGVAAALTQAVNDELQVAGYFHAAHSRAPTGHNSPTPRGAQPSGQHQGMIQGDSSYGVWPHPSGVGCFIVIPAGVMFKVLRSDVHKGVDDEPGVILKGYSDHHRRFLDLDTPLSGKATYVFLGLNNTTGEYELIDTFAGLLEPQLTYSAIQDADSYDTVNPRDALILFYSTRLAQLVREGRLYVKGASSGETNHDRRYPVSPAYEYRHQDLPVISADHAGSTGVLGDLGGNYTQEDVQIEFMAAAASIEERDSLAGAIRGLLKETDAFLEDAGMTLPMFAHFEMGVEPTSPPLYTLRWSICGTVYTWHGERDLPWELLPLTGWLA